MCIPVFVQTVQHYFAVHSPGCDSNVPAACINSQYSHLSSLEIYSLKLKPLIHSRMVSWSIRNQQVFRAIVESIFPARNPLFFNANARNSLRMDKGQNRVGGKGVTECLHKSAREHLKAEHHVCQGASFTLLWH